MIPGMKKIIIELIEDEKSGGYTIVSDDLFDGAVISEGDNIVNALKNFIDAYETIEQYKNETGQ